MSACQCLQEATEWQVPPVAALVIPLGYQPAAGSAEAAAATATAQFRIILGHSHIGQDGVSGRLQQTMLQDEDDNEVVQDAEAQLALRVSTIQLGCIGCCAYSFTSFGSSVLGEAQWARTDMSKKNKQIRPPSLSSLQGSPRVAPRHVSSVSTLPTWLYRGGSSSGGAMGQLPLHAGGEVGGYKLPSPLLSSAASMQPPARSHSGSSSGPSAGSEDMGTLRSTASGKRLDGESLGCDFQVSVNEGAL